MDLTRYTTFPAELEDEWNTLLSRSYANYPFMRFGYLHDWWSSLGGGEWQDGELVLITGSQDGKLAGIAPLFIAKKPDGKSVLMLVGSHEVSDYLDVIVSPADLPEFAAELLSYLHTHITGWETLNLYNLLDSSPSIPAFESAAADAGWHTDLSTLQPSPYIALPGDWETYLAGIDKKQRHEIRRKMRRAENAEQPAKWYVLSDPEKLEQDIDSFLDLMAQGSEKAVFLSEAMVPYMRQVMRTAFKEGYLHLSFLEIGGGKAAAKLCFDYQNRLWGYNSGFNNEFMSYSPGWVLMGHLLTWANEQKREVFDFMRGDEEYKYRFGAVDRFVKLLSLQP